MQVEARVLEKEQVAESIFYIKMKEDYLSKKSNPGQFVHVRVGSGLDPLLRRPLSIAGTQPDEGIFQFFFRLAGEGTRQLSRLRPGDSLDCLGPLGTGFKRLAGGKAYILAGGIGAAPLIFQAQRLLEEGNGVAFFYGGASSGQLIPLDRYLLPGANLVIATEDGSTGRKGNIVDVFTRELENKPVTGTIFACGPRPMLKALVESNKQWRLPLQLSLEERMACAIGACQGCVVESALESKIGNGEKKKYSRVCLDGPVFEAGEVQL